MHGIPVRRALAPLFALTILALASASARAVAQSCVRTSEDLSVPSIRVEADGRSVFVALEHARLSIDAANGRAEVSRPLELVGTASVAWRTARAIELEGAVFVPRGAAVSPSAHEGALRFTSVAEGYARISVSGVPITCEALELGAPIAADAAWSAMREADRPLATGVRWVARSSRLSLRTRPDAGATTITIGGLDAFVQLPEVAREGSWVRVLVRVGAIEVRAWAQVVDLEPPPSGGGGIGGLGRGRCENAAPADVAFEGELELPVGLEIFAAPGVGRWARVPVPTRARVRYEIGVEANGQEWARLLTIDGVQPIGTAGLGSRCPATELAMAYARASALPIPDLAGLRARASASEPQPVGVAAVSAARTDRAIAPSRMSIGHDFGCVLVEGRVQCFGEAAHGQLGDGSTAGRDTLRAVPGLEGVIELVRAGGGSCALLGDGTVRCWGSLGGEDHTRPTPIEGIAGAVTIAGGPGHACAVLEDGRVACWGRVPGEVTRDATSTRAAIVRGVADAIAIASGGGHACALRVDGTLACWGANGSRQLGVTGAHPRITAIPPLSDVVWIAAYGERTCAIVRGGTAHCWGEASGGSLGIAGAPTGPTSVIDRAVEIALGRDFVCFRRDDASIACFASYSNREVLAGGVSGVGRPAAIELPNVAALGASDTGMCALDASGATWCWGTRRTRGAVLVEGVAHARSVAAGYRESCAVLEDGAVTCWPRDPHDYVPFTDARTLALGAGERCAIDANGRAVCSGISTRALPGRASAVSVGGGATCVILDGCVQCSARSLDTASASADVPDDVLGEAIDVAVGSDRVCVVERAGRVVCWRMARDGDEGAPPEVVVGVTDALEVGVTFGWGCVRTRSGAIQCFASHGPRELRGLRGARDLSIGGFGACVVRAEGDVACFDFEHAAPGRDARFTRPAIVSGTRGATEVSVGYEHACARFEDGTVRCWGDATGGRVDGQRAPARVPSR
ncbi:MAG: hypothetical protein J0L92_09115 [Deltaproteobacteria bacterium]|nr:hypothetical protein [Deltaproteobacteria bacterium]